VEDTPAFGADVRTDYILGIGKSEGHVKLLLDIDRVLSDASLEQIAGAGAETSDQPVLEGAMAQAA
jgi:chemotaxis signal transduction protein